jgi:hypothetical protein
MLDLRSAVMHAQNYLKDLKDMLGNSLEDLRLEEVELSDDKQYWLITLGYSRLVDKTKNKNTLLEGMIPHYERDYKIFKVNAQTGEVEAMKIRE